MEIISYKGVLSYDELEPLEVASFGDGAATKIQFDERMEGPYWTVRENGNLIGFMHADLREGVLHIARIEVARDFRRRGIAWRLLDAARAFAQDVGAQGLLLRVRGDNQGARALYTKYGFRETGRIQRRFACPLERLAVETDLRVKKDGTGYKYPVRLLRDVREIGAGQFNEEVSGIKDFTLTDPDVYLLPALAALKPLLKPGNEILYVMTDNDAVNAACQARKFFLQSSILDMTYDIVLRP